MARESVFEQQIMSHDQVEVDLPTFLGERNHASRAGETVGLTLLQRLKNFTVIFTGELPHSTIETAFNFAEPSMINLGFPEINKISRWISEGQ